MRPSAKISCVLFLCSAPAFAEPVLITAPQSLSPGQTTITPTAGGAPVPLADADIIVRGTLLNINGRQTIKSLTVERSNVATAGRISHAPGFSHDYSGGAGTDVVYGMELTTLGDVTIQPQSGNLVASRFDLAGAGFLDSDGPGQGEDSDLQSSGGGHGGSGAMGAYYTTPRNAGGDCYGSAIEPRTFGSGGGGNWQTNVKGGRGGGAARLIVGGTLTVGGTINCGGANGNAASMTGGGAGGSVWITCSTLAGGGSILADGGNAPAGNNQGGGAGGGGRVAIEYSTNLFTGAMHCYGGSGWSNGGAGTLFLRPAGGDGTIYVDNGSIAGESTDFSGSEVNVFSADLVVRNKGIVGSTRAGGPMEVTFLHNVTIEPGAGIGATGRGYAAGTGPGAGVNAYYASGGGHAGRGGNGNSGVGGECYGDFEFPITLGSGGGAGHDGPGGIGGGAIHLIVGGTLTNNGAISSNGTNPTPLTAGGGAGGSVWITCGTLTGTGSITANGGSVSNGGGGGGGGRIRIDATVNTMTGPVQAFGGGTDYWGGAGTIWLNPGTGTPTLIIDNHDSADDVPFAPAQRTELAGVASVEADMVIGSAAVVSHNTPESALSLHVAGDLTVQPQGILTESFNGHPGGAGPGAGSSGAHGGGGGYGGAGGAGYPGTTSGGGVYGSVTQPSDFGSGGGNPTGLPTQSGAGGGALALVVDGTLTVDGEVSSNGLGGSAATGGGSGGSVWIVAGAVGGSGLVSANGGNAGTAAQTAGGGGGGRIAVDTCTLSLPTTHITTNGGTGHQAGGAGTVSLGVPTVTITGQPPENSEYTAGEPASLAVIAVGVGAKTYQWYLEGVALTDGGRIAGSQSAQLEIDPIDCADAGTYTCVISNGCGSVESDDAVIVVLPASDYDGSGFVDLEDYSAFVADFEAGVDAADFDHSGFVDIEDFTAFVQAFEAGC